MNNSIDFVDFDSNFLALSWKWLNDPEIRILTSTPEITLEGQLKWFNGLNVRTDYKVWGMSCDGTKIGVAGLKKITESDAEYFGYIGVKEFWNKGLSSAIFSFILDYARMTGIGRLWLTVSKENKRAINAYQKAGFKIFNTLDSDLQMELNEF